MFWEHKGRVRFPAPRHEYKKRNIGCAFCIRVGVSETLECLATGIEKVLRYIFKTCFENIGNLYCSCKERFPRIYSRAIPGISFVWAPARCFQESRRPRRQVIFSFCKQNIENPFDSPRKPSSWLSSPPKSKNILQRMFFDFVRDRRVELLTTVWKTVILPIN